MKLKSPALIILTLLVVLAAGCAPNNNSARQKPKSGQTKLYNIETVTNKAINNLGDKKAFKAILSAWDKGYSAVQINKGIENNLLAADGSIKGVFPKNKPQDELNLTLSSPVIAMKSGIYSTLLAGAQINKEIDDRLELRNTMWTVWLLGVIASGYSVEQITDFMISHDQPALALPGFYPIITENKRDPSTGKDKVEMVKPSLQPEWIYGKIEKPDTADAFITDLGKDFEKLIEGSGKQNNNESAAPGGTVKGKFKPRSFRLKLTFLGKDQRQTMRSSDLILRIDAKGKATGSYSVETYEKTTVSETTRVEDGTFQGQAIFPKAKGQMIRLDLDGTRHMKISATTFSDGMTSVRDQNISIKKMFQGVISVDYHKGSGFLYGEAAIYQWKIGE